MVYLWWRILTVKQHRLGSYVRGGSISGVVICWCKFRNFRIRQRSMDHWSHCFLRGTAIRRFMSLKITIYSMRTFVCWKWTPHLTGTKGSLLAFLQVYFSCCHDFKPGLQSLSVATIIFVLFFLSHLPYFCSTGITSFTSDLALHFLVNIAFVLFLFSNIWLLFTYTLSC